MKLRITRSSLCSIALAAAVTAISSVNSYASPPVPPGGPTAGTSASVQFGVPVTDSYCGGDVCMRAYKPVNSQDPNDIVIRTWAGGYTFKGHFQLQTPGNQAPHNIGNGVNPAGSSGATFVAPDLPGWYTVTAWQNTGSSWENIGSSQFELCWTALGTATAGGCGAPPLRR